MEIAGRRALLTGATGGLGRAIARALADRGAHLVLSGRKGEALESLAAELPGSGHRVSVSDLGEPGAAGRLAEDVADTEILVANAGLPGMGRMEELDPEGIGRTLRVNLESPIMLAQVLGPAMAERGEGHLVFVSSLSGKAGSPRSSIYSASKFGLRGFALALRTDLTARGVGVSLVSPGFVRGEGMFADSGASPPPGMGTATPEQVAAGTVRAIERNLVEVAVAPLQQRAISHLALASPRIADFASRGSVARKVADQIADGQGDKV